MYYCHYISVDNNSFPVEFQNAIKLILIWKWISSLGNQNLIINILNLIVFISWLLHMAYSRGYYRRSCFSQHYYYKTLLNIKSEKIELKIILNDIIYYGFDFFTVEMDVIWICKLLKKFFNWLFLKEVEKQINYNGSKNGFFYFISLVTQ